MDSLKERLKTAIDNAETEQVSIGLDAEEINLYIDDLNSLTNSFVEEFSEEYGIDITYSDLDEDKLTVEIIAIEEEEEEDPNIPF